MTGLRPLLFEDLEIAAPGVTVLRLGLNRHLPETLWVRRHRHEFVQILAYLSGSGWQTVGDERMPVSTGRVIGIPVGVDHAFEKEKARSPLCLVLDLRTDSACLAEPVSAILSAEAQAEIRRCLSWLAGLRPGEGVPRVRECGVVLQVAGLLMESLTPESHVPNRARGARHVARVRQWLRTRPSDCWDGERVAAELGMRRDHLNRLLRIECGLSIGQLIAEHRLELARRGLVETDSEIQDIGASVGILDRNYFARWFRRQTGLTPSAWRLRHRGNSDF